jgi:hypothetical protein
MRLPTKYSDLERDEIMFHQPNRAVALALAALAVTMLVLASLSSGRVAPSAQRSTATHAITIDAATGVKRGPEQRFNP